MRTNGATNGHDRLGRFAQGNPGGPGRPRRAVEREYLATVAEACPPEVWRRVVERAVADAEAGDAKARDWLSRHLLGEHPSSLLALAADEAGGRTADDEVADLADEVRRNRRLKEARKSVLGEMGASEADESMPHSAR